MLRVGASIGDADRTFRVLAPSLSFSIKYKYTVLSQIFGYPLHPCGRHTWNLLALRVVSESLGGRRVRRSRSYDTRIIICVCLSLSLPTNVSAYMYFRFRVK